MLRTAVRSGLVVMAVAVGCGGTVTGSGEDPESVEGTGGDGEEGGDGGEGGGGGSTGGWFGSCFAAGTRIATSRGEVPIEALREGDTVLGYDAATHRVVEETVRTTFVHLARTVGRVALGNGRELRITDEHPVYLPDARRYVPAADLAGDERLLSLGDGPGTTSTIAGGFVANALGTETVYNIEVDRVHNYFAEGVLVHNKSGGRAPAGGAQNACDRPYMPVVTLAACAPTAACVDPNAPLTEYVRLPSADEPPPEPTPPPDAAPPGPIDGGVFDGALPPAEDAAPPAASDGGDRDAGPPWSDAAPPRTADAGPAVFAPWSSLEQCVPGAGVALLAFDARSANQEPVYSIHATNEACEGLLVGEVHFGSQDPQPAGRWQSHCARVEAASVFPRVTVTDTSGGEVRNVRFVTGCECPRDLKLPTECGIGWGTGGGSACVL